MMFLLLGYILLSLVHTGHWQHRALVGGDPGSGLQVAGDAEASVGGSSFVLVWERRAGTFCPSRPSLHLSEYHQLHAQLSTDPVISYIMSSQHNQLQYCKSTEIHNIIKHENFTN